MEHAVGRALYWPPTWQLAHGTAWWAPVSGKRVLLWSMLLAGCQAVPDKALDVQAQRESILKHAEETLVRLYAESPKARAEIAAAAGPDDERVEGNGRRRSGCAVQPVSERGQLVLQVRHVRQRQPPIRERQDTHENPRQRAFQPEIEGLRGVRGRIDGPQP